MLSRRILIRFDTKEVYSKFVNLGFLTTKRNFFLAVPKLVFFNDSEIISLYNTLIRGYSYWFRCADNVTCVKNVIWALRISCLKTLVRKSKKKLKWALTTFTNNVSAKLPNGNTTSLPSVHRISQLNSKLLLNINSNNWGESLFKKYFLRLDTSQFLFSKCAVKNCCNTDIDFYSFKKLTR